jgi:hypothetical protein
VYVEYLKVRLVEITEVKTAISELNTQQRELEVQRKLFFLCFQAHQLGLRCGQLVDLLLNEWP